MYFSSLEQKSIKYTLVMLCVCYVMCVLSAVLAGVRCPGTSLDMNAIIAFSFIKYRYQHFRE